MYCLRCGESLPDGTVICPKCGAQNGPSVQQPASAPESKADRRGRGYAAIMSSLFVFPTLVCIAKDLLDFDRRMTWSAYAIGIAMCLWMCLVLPAMKPKRPALTACICLSVISLYMVFLAYINGNAGIYVDYILPLSLMITISSAVLSVLISYKIIDGIHIASAIAGQVGLLSIGTEILFDIQKRGAVDLRWSIFTAIAAVSAIAFIEAVNYAHKVNDSK